tara:strand:+ start:2274 stop:3722 length:1449 start_codon:yes stop_codon:yes gene_type:complete
MIIASRISGTRPLGVFFELDQPAHHVIWKVDNKDTFTGQIMAYVFTEVGTHTVQAIIADDGGMTTEEVNIHVGFHIAPLLYVANDGDDSNGGDKNHPLKTIGVALDRAAPGTKIYIRKGDVFNIHNWARIKQPGIYLRPYGGGRKPVLRGGFLYCTTDDVRIQGLLFEGAAHAVVFAGNTADNLIYNCEITNASIGVKLNDANVDDAVVAKNIVIKGCDIHHVQHYGVYGKTNGFAFLNAKVREYSSHHHGIRIASGQRVVVNQSYIMSSNMDSYTAITIRGAGDDTSFTKATISENVFERVCTSAPQNDTFKEDISEVEWYNNTFDRTRHTTTGYALVVVGKNIKVVGNTFLHWGTAISLRGKHITKKPQDILIQGNRHLADWHMNQGHYFIFGTGTNIACLDNLHESYTFARWAKVIQFGGTLENARNYYNIVRNPNLPLFRINGQDSNSLNGWTEFGTGNINTAPGWAFSNFLVDPYNP